MINLACWLEYSLQLHKCLVASSIKEATEKIELIAAELEKLASWEAEGKIKSFGDVDGKGFLGIQLIDDSIGPELRAMTLVLINEFDEVFDDETCYPELFEDATAGKKDADGKLKGGR